MSALTNENCSQLAAEMGLEASGFNACAMKELDPIRLSVIPIFLVSLIGNVCILLILAGFRKHKVVDVLVGGLALTDLFATLGPVAMSIYSYLSLNDFAEGTSACTAFATIAMFTRSSSCMIATVTTIDRFVAIAAPFFYKKRATPRAYVVVVCACWLLSVCIAIVPLLESNSPVASHGGFCLFEFTSKYAVSIVVIALIQFVLVLMCFFLTTLAIVVQSRSRLKRSGLRKSEKYAEQKLRLHARRETLTEKVDKLRRRTVSNLFQVRVEAEFLTMFAVVVALFYVTWLPIVVSERKVWRLEAVLPYINDFKLSVFVITILQFFI